MSLPIVAIVGRPNVGKSSLLNCLVGKRISIVDPTPGVTRDRVSSPCPIGAGDDTRYIELVDTGGMGIEDRDNLTAEVEDQIELAVDEAALILFVVDAREGVTALDRHVAQRLRKQNKPVILVANKMDEVHMTAELGELHSLGFGEPRVVSATHAFGRHDLLDAVAAALGDAAPSERPLSVMKLAIVGKRNAGKSTFINALAGEQRVIVSETPGTTRDSVDVTVDVDGQSFIVIDTAGAQKRKSLAGDIEFYSRHRMLRSVRRANVVALMLDASVPVSQVDKELAGEIAELYKPVVLVVNKWDLAKDFAGGEDYRDYFAKKFPELSYAPIALTTASQNLNVRQTVDLAMQLFQQAQVRVGTPVLNEAFEAALATLTPGYKTGTKPPKIYYAAQIATAPPTIVCFVNDVRSFDESYQRFMLKKLRERLPYSEVPIRLLLRRHRGGKEAVYKEFKDH